MFSDRKYILNLNIMNDKKLSRRSFIAKSAIATAGATIGLESMAMSPLVKKVGANDKIRMGFIGIGNRGTQLMTLFRDNADVEVAALCDVYEPYLDRNRSTVNERYLALGKVPKLNEQFGKDVKRYKDFRKLLAADNDTATSIKSDKQWTTITRGPLPGAGKWTHQYADAGNTACSDDRRVKGPLGVLWFPNLPRPVPQRV